MEARWRIRVHRPTSTRPPRRSEGTKRNLVVDSAGLLMQASLEFAVGRCRQWRPRHCVCPRVAPMLAASSSRRARTPGPEPRRSAASRTSANVRSTSRSSPWTSTAMRSRPTRRPFPLETALGTPERPILGTASSPSSREARRRYGEACRLATPLACSWSSRRADSLEDQESIWFGRVGRIHANPVPVGVVGV